MLKNIKIGTKLLIAFMAVGLIPFAISVSISLLKASNEFSNQAFEKLRVVQQIKKAQIEEYFDDLANQISVITRNATVIEALKNFSSSINNESGEVNESLVKWHTMKSGSSLAQFKDAFGYYDLMLISKEGTVVYSVKKEEVSISERLDRKNKGHSYWNIF